MLGWIQSLFSLVAQATIFDWVVVLVILGVILYYIGTWTHDHFRRQGMPSARTVPFLGNMASVAFGRTSYTDFTMDLYKQGEGHQAIGIFQFMRPTVLLRDPELIKMVTVKYFDHFVDHQVFTGEKVEPIFSRSLFSLNGQEWRDMRSTLSPAFTASKMRIIFKLINRCGKQMVDFLEEKINDSSSGEFEVEMKDFFTRFANDVIATSSFGIECDSLRQPKNEFYLMGRELNNTSGIKNLIFVGYMLSPKLMEMLGIPFSSQKVQDFFHNTVQDAVHERQKSGIHRPDMLQLLIQAREGELKAEAEDEHESIKGAKTKKLTDMDVTAQAAIFFFAGFDTVSTALSFCIFALTRHKDVEERLQREVDDVFEKYDENLTYEATQELKYTDMFINEVMRLYTAAPALDRRCTSDFTIPSQGDTPAYTVRKDDIVWISVQPLHVDPQYWDDPQKFDPERFSEENKHKIKPFTFMPFGIGPRICIGSRFALMEMKVALAHLVRRFQFLATEKTPKVVEYAHNDLSGNLKGGYWVGVTLRAQ